VNIKYYPADTQRAYATLGIKLPMNALRTNAASGIFNMSHTTEDQAVSNYINLLLTRRGERYMQPQYGIGIQEKLFENDTPQLHSRIEYEIMTQSARWLPYIINDSISINSELVDRVSPVEKSNTVHITIQFRVYEHGANRTITFFGDNGVISYGVT